MLFIFIKKVIHVENLFIKNYLNDSNDYYRLFSFNLKLIKNGRDDYFTLNMNHSFYFIKFHHYDLNIKFNKILF